ncbi:MAG: trypsin-like peptidase domain-containing protein [Steroidobacteraceae bacterium]
MARAAPAVVNVYTARVVTERVPRNLFEDPFGELGPRYRQRVERSLGSGVIVDDLGHIVTNHHVIADADSIRVQLADGRVANAKIVGRDPDTDLAVLQVALPRLPVMPLGRSDQLRVGDVVLAIGNPIGLSQTVTQGIVSATGRGQLGVATFENFIQTDAPINVGNSGGALINAAGELVGINTAVIAKNLGVEGIGFAIPVNLVRGVLGEIVARRVVRGWIGIVPEDIDEEQARVSAAHLRELNHMKYGQAVLLGRKLKLDFAHVPSEDFEQKRREFHARVQASFFEQRRILGTEVYIVRRGDSLWSITQKYAGVPVWLLQQYNPDLELGALRAGLQLVVPKIEDVNGG